MEHQESRPNPYMAVTSVPFFSFSAHRYDTDSPDTVTLGHPRAAYAWPSHFLYSLPHDIRPSAASHAPAIFAHGHATSPSAPLSSHSRRSLDSRLRDAHAAIRDSRYTTPTVLSVPFAHASRLTNSPSQRHSTSTPRCHRMPQDARIDARITMQVHHAKMLRDAHAAWLPQAEAKPPTAKAHARLSSMAIPRQPYSLSTHSTHSRDNRKHGHKERMQDRCWSRQRPRQ